MLRKKIDVDMNDPNALIRAYNSEQAETRIMMEGRNAIYNLAHNGYGAHMSNTSAYLNQLLAMNNGYSSEQYLLAKTQFVVTGEALMVQALETEMKLIRMRYPLLFKGEGYNSGPQAINELVEAARLAMQRALDTDQECLHLRKETEALEAQLAELEANRQFQVGNEDAEMMF